MIDEEIILALFFPRRGSRGLPLPPGGNYSCQHKAGIFVIDSLYMTSLPCSSSVSFGQPLPNEAKKKKRDKQFVSSSANNPVKSK